MGLFFMPPLSRKAKQSQLTKHRQRWRRCKLCELHKYRRNVVLIRGCVPCEVLFVGEAPGPSEDDIGQPFIGPAGKLLDHWLIKAGYNVCDHDILPRRVAFTNVIACIPKGEDGDKFSEPPDYAIKACKERLHEIINICKPRAIVRVGKHARKAIKDDYDVEVVSSIDHPAYILRMDASQRGLAERKQIVTLIKVLDDLCLAE